MPTTLTPADGALQALKTTQWKRLLGMVMRDRIWRVPVLYDRVQVLLTVTLGRRDEPRQPTLTAALVRIDSRF